MRCPFCGFDDQKVIESRPGRDGDSIRRRRECLACGRRFTTFEEAERPRLFVIKRGGAREEFSREKVFDSMRIACRKRPVPVEVLRNAVAQIEWDLFQEYEEEAPTSSIGLAVLRALQDIDTVAYVRFASVYKEFDTISDFTRIVESMQEVPGAAR
jgi:transcriptional repressor NrdR